MEKWQLDAAVARFLGVEPPIVFLDEINTCSPQLQAAMLSIVGEPGIGKSGVVKKIARKLKKKLTKIKIEEVQPADVVGIPRFVSVPESRFIVLQTPKSVGEWLQPGRAARALQRQGGRAARRRPTRNTRRTQ